MPDYARDANQNETYEVDINGHQMVEHNRYAQTAAGVPFYPKTAQDDEFMDPNLKLIEQNGAYVYPYKVHGQPNYRRVGQKEVYEQMGGGQWVMGKNRATGDGVYAKDANGDEYYPDDRSFAKKAADGSAVYAQTAVGQETVFPKDANGDEYYLGDVDPTKPNTIPTRYAVEGTTLQVYPVQRTAGGAQTQHVLNQTYATRDRVGYYPRDGQNNEFYIAKPTAAEMVLEQYATTNDGQVIVPSINDVPQIVAGKTPTIAQDDILGRLYREPNVLSTDFLTKIASSIQPKVARLPYSYKDKTTQTDVVVTPKAAAAAAGGPFYTTWSFWILMVVSLIVKSLVLWWFFFRPGRTGGGRVP